MPSISKTDNVIISLISGHDSHACGCILEILYAAVLPIESSVFPVRFQIALWQ